MAKILDFPTILPNHPLISKLVEKGLPKPDLVMTIGNKNLVLEIKGYDFYLDYVKDVYKLRLLGIKEYYSEISSIDNDEELMKTSTIIIETLKEAKVI